MKTAAMTVACVACAVGLQPTPAAGVRLEMSASVSITSKPKEMWENKPILARCSWGVKVGEGTWNASSEAERVTVRVFASKLWAPSYADYGLFSMEKKLDSHNSKILGETKVAPGGQHSAGKGFGGQFDTSFMPPEPGQWYVGCYVTAPSLYKTYEIYRKSGNACDGSTFAWCDVNAAYVFVSRPKAFAPGELPVPEVIAPLKAPGGEIVAIPLDVNGVPLTARIPPAIVGVKKGSFLEVAWEPGSDHKATFWEWAAKYTGVFEERWHLQLLKRQPGGMFKPIETFSGPVTQQEFQRIVSPAFFDLDKDGGGVWRLKTWITQENTPQGLISGAASAVDFEVKLLPKNSPAVAKPSQWPPIVPPAASANMSDQPAGAVVPSPAPAPLPSASTVRSADAPAFVPGTGQPLRSALPAVQAPTASTVAPAGPPASNVARTSGAPAGSVSRTPDWAALGNAPARAPQSPPGIAVAPAPQSPAGVVPPWVTRTQPAAPATIAAASPAVAGDATLRRDLAAVSCVPATGTSRFTCATRAGFDRCEAFRLQRKVDQCVLNERR